MALIYDDIAILSVGMSCQTAWRLKEAQGMIDGIVGQAGRQHGTPFDWIIARPTAVRQALETGRYRPDSPEDLVTSKNRFFWRDGGIWYWHEATALSDFDGFRSKFDRLAETMERLRRKRVLAIWSNCQADLTAPGRRFPSLQPQVSGPELVRLARTLEAWSPGCRLLPVVHPERITADPPLRLPHAVYDAQDGPRDWQGNPDIWNRLLTQAVTAHLENRPLGVT